MPPTADKLCKCSATVNQMNIEPDLPLAQNLISKATIIPPSASSSYSQLLRNPVATGKQSLGWNPSSHQASMNNTAVQNWGTHGSQVFNSRIMVPGNSPFLGLTNETVGFPNFAQSNKPKPQDVDIRCFERVWVEPQQSDKGGVTPGHWAWVEIPCDNIGEPDPSLDSFFDSIPGVRFVPFGSGLPLAPKYASRKDVNPDDLNPIDKTGVHMPTDAELNQKAWDAFEKRVGELNIQKLNDFLRIFDPNLHFDEQLSIFIPTLLQFTDLFGAIKEPKTGGTDLTEHQRAELIAKVDRANRILKDLIAFEQKYGKSDWIDQIIQNVKDYIDFLNDIIRGRI